MIKIIKKYRVILSVQQQIKVIYLFVMMTIGAILEAIGIGLLVPLVSVLMDSSLIERNIILSMICKMLRLKNHVSFVVFAVIALLILYIIKNIFLLYNYAIQYRFTNYNRLDAQKKILNIYLHRPYEFFLQADSAEIIRIINSDISSVYSLLNILLNIATQSVIAIMLVCTVMIISPFITIALGISMGATVLVLTRWVRPLLKNAGLKVKVTGVELNRWLIQSINGIKDIKIAQTENFFYEKYISNGKTQADASYIHSILSALPKIVLEVICVGVVLVAILIRTICGYDFTELIPTLSAFVMAGIKLLPAFNTIANGMTSIAYSEWALDALLNDFECLEKDSNRYENLVSTNDGSEITLKDSFGLSNVDYKYPDEEKLILSGANLKIKKGYAVGIIGSSGAGKTTTVDIILGLLRPQSGTVECDNLDIRENYKGWISQIGYIPQMIFMLDGSIKENIIFGRKTENEDFKIWKALEEAQLADFVKSLPNGIDTEIGERGIRISGGQRQRIGIARALFLNPDILVMDEATSALDTDTENALMDSIEALHGKKTMIIIAHRLTTIKNCDEVYRVENGKIERV